MTAQRPNEIEQADALDYLAGFADGSVDAVITDPPYAEIDRPYGRLTEQAWAELMYPLTLEFKRVLKPTGSAVVIIQPNQSQVGSTRAWVFRYMTWCIDNWNMVQDAYWWNYTAPPVSPGNNGYLKPSIKPCVWLGAPDCYRDQTAVLWGVEQEKLAEAAKDRTIYKFASGLKLDRGRTALSMMGKDGAVPFNLIPVSNTNRPNSAGAHGHGAGTPYDLALFWTLFLTKPNDLILDPFMGSGTMALAARNSGRNYVGCERDATYAAISNRRLSEPYTPDMFQDAPPVEPDAVTTDMFAEWSEAQP